MADQASTERKRGPSVRAERLTEAALDLFAERGFAAVTIKDITAEIGVNPALIYYYFDGKEDLFPRHHRAGRVDGVSQLHPIANPARQSR